MVESKGSRNGLPEERVSIQEAMGVLPENDPFQRGLRRLFDQFGNTTIARDLLDQVSNGENYDSLKAELFRDGSDGRGKGKPHGSADVLGPRANEGLLPKTIMSPRRARRRY